MSPSRQNPPNDPETILRRIETLSADMIAIQRRAVTEGADLRREWDDLFIERMALEVSLWGDGTKVVRSPSPTKKQDSADLDRAASEGMGQPQHAPRPKPKKK
jgi:hypothetical protein